jgi:hypothetical protein
MTAWTSGTTVLDARGMHCCVLMKWIERIRLPQGYRTAAMLAGAQCLKNSRCPRRPIAASRDKRLFYLINLNIISGFETRIGKRLAFLNCD